MSINQCRPDTEQERKQSYSTWPIYWSTIW